MANNVGTICLSEKDGRKFFKGVIKARTFSGGVFLVPNPRAGGNAPDWKIKRASDRSECGAAWDGKTGDGKAKLRITIAEDGMDKALYLTALDTGDKTDDGEVWDILWYPPSSGQRKGGATAPAGAPLNDEIPFG